MSKTAVLSLREKIETFDFNLKKAMFKLQSSADRGLQIQHRKRASEILLIKNSQRARYGTWTHANYFRHTVKTAQPEKVYCFTPTFGRFIKHCWFGSEIFRFYRQILGSIVVSIPACHAGDWGPIPRRGEKFSYLLLCYFSSIKADNTKYQKLAIVLHSLKCT